MGRLSENSVVDIKNKSFAVTSEVARAVGSAAGAFTPTTVGGRVEQTQGFIFSADETTDVGYESGTTVSPDYTPHTSRFSGKIDWVRIDLGEDAKDADERFRIAMARQ
jgi:hypothetical protein